MGQVNSIPSQEEYLLLWKTSELSALVISYLNHRKKELTKNEYIRYMTIYNLLPSSIVKAGEEQDYVFNFISKLEKSMDFLQVLTLFICCSYGTVSDKMDSIFQLYKDSHDANDSLTKLQVSNFLSNSLKSLAFMAVLLPSVKVDAFDIKDKKNLLSGLLDDVMKRDPLISKQALLTWVLKSESLINYNKIFENTPSRGYEKQAILALQSDSELKEGENWYVISLKWLNAWREYVGWTAPVRGDEELKEEDGEAEVPEQAPLKRRRESSFIYGERPGPIDNELISSTGGIELKGGLNENDDYVLLSASQWKLIKAWYGGGPVLERIVQAVGGMEGKKHMQIELYPLFLQVARAGVHGRPTMSLSYIISASKRDSIISLLRKIGERLKICPSTALHNMKIHIKNQTNNIFYCMGLLSAKAMVTNTLEEHGLQGGEMLLVEVREEGGKWKRESVKWSNCWKEFEVGDKLDALSEKNWYVCTVTKVWEDKIEVNFYEWGSRLTGLKNRKGSGPDGGNLEVAMYKTKSTPRGREENEEGNTRESRSVFSESREGPVEVPGASGLNNLGNTCFMNSTIQCLSNTKALTTYFLDEKFKNEINKKNPLGTGGQLALCYAALVKSLWSGKYSAVSPLSFKQAISKFAPQFSGFSQHDSQELLAFLLDGLHEDLNLIVKKPYVAIEEGNGRADEVVAEIAWEGHTKRNKSIIVDIFQGQCKSTITCPNKKCNKESVTFDPFSSLTLSLPEDNDRFIPITIVKLPALSDQPLEISSTFQTYKVKCSKLGLISDLKKALSLLCGIPVQELIIAEIYKGKIYRTLSDNKEIGMIHNNDIIYAYELEKGGDRELQLMNRHIVSSDRDGASKYEAFGVPIILSFKKDSTNQQIFDKIQLWFRYIIRKPRDKGKEKEKGRDRDNGKEKEKEEEKEKESNDKERVKEKESNDKESGKEKVEVYDDNLPFKFSFVNNTGAFCGSCRVGSGCDGCQFKGDSELFPSSSDMAVALDWSEPTVTYNTEVLGRTLINPDDDKKEKDNNELSLKKLLDVYVKEEELGEEDKWYCPSCKVHVQARKKLDLWKMPDVLVVHIKRFLFNSRVRSKINSLVTYPIEGFDLTPWLLSKSPAVYDLFAVSNHMGGLSGGHYTASCLNDHNNTWYLFNDSSVTQIKAEEALSQHAYVLFYKKRKSVSLKDLL